MDWLILPGAVLSALGLVGLVASAVKIVKARRQGLDDDAMRAQLGRVMALNMGSLFLSVIGLMMVVVGVLMG
ncbi:MAG: hypothetical protein GY945_03085 [Rhodobacteraceae bacterium]|nr:hypothetical protein [Paracoccaceae bacterium]